METNTTSNGSNGSTGELSGTRVAILAETLYEDLELWYPYYRLREAGADVFVVGSGSAETYQSKHGYPVTVEPKDVQLGPIAATIAFFTGPNGETIEFFQVN